MWQVFTRILPTGLMVLDFYVVIHMHSHGLEDRHLIRLQWQRAQGRGVNLGKDAESTAGQFLECARIEILQQWGDWRPLRWPWVRFAVEP